MNAHIRDRRTDTILLLLNERLHASTIRSEHGAIPICSPTGSPTSPASMNRR